MAFIKKRTRLGRHILVDFFGVDAKKLQDRKKLMAVLRSALKKGGFNIIKEAGGHKFKGGGEGVTGFILLAQSHAAFHSYPEYGYMALDIYSCGDHDPKPIVRCIEKHLQPKKILRFFHNRGTIISSNSHLTNHSKTR